MSGAPVLFWGAMMMSSHSMQESDIRSSFHETELDQRSAYGHREHRKLDESIVFS